MYNVSHPQMEERIARCRVIFSVLVAAAVLIDPLQPTLDPWLRMLGGSLPPNPLFVGTIVLHAIYSLAAYVAVTYRVAAIERFTSVTTAVDVTFAAVLAFVTEGKSSLFYPFFTFAIVRTGFQAGMRRTMLVTAVSIGMWFALVAWWAPAGISLYVMRPVYLVVVGYLVGSLGEERLGLEREVRAHAITEQRLRIARDLHDGCAQVLGAVNLQLDSCRRLLGNGRLDEVVKEIAELQESVNGEHDELRAYLRTLAGQSRPEPAAPGADDPRVVVHVSLDASGAMVDQVFRVLREGIANVRRHAHARVANVTATCEDGRVQIAIDDDGRGFDAVAAVPWSIESRVQELGGSLAIERERTPGAHLTISLPTA